MFISITTSLSLSSETTQIQYQILIFALTGQPAYKDHLAIKTTLDQTVGWS